MKKVIDQANWKRREHFKLFGSYQEPFFGLVSEVNCSSAYQSAKQAGVSFYLIYLHKLLTAVNSIEEFRCRIDGDDVVVFDKVHASATVARADETFAFSFMKYDPSFEQFAKYANAEIEAVRTSTGLRLNEESQSLDVIQFSAIPWVKFTALSHARNLSVVDSIPKISVGKIEENDGRQMMAVSVHAHHGLVDGLHVGRFFERFQTLLDGGTI